MSNLKSTFILKLELILLGTNLSLFWGKLRKHFSDKWANFKDRLEKVEKLNEQKERTRQWVSEQNEINNNSNTLPNSQETDPEGQSNPNQTQTGDTYENNTGNEGGGGE